MVRNKNKKAHRRGLGNGGFSLVEILVAISILIAIAVPMALNLATSAQINNRAKQIASASNMAGSMMEVLQAIDLKDVLADMNGYNVDCNGDPLSYTISGDMLGNYTVDGRHEVAFVDGKYVPVSGENASVKSVIQNGISSTLFVGNPQNNYSFLVSGIDTGDSYVDLLATFKFERAYGNLYLSELNENTTVCIRQSNTMDAAVADEFKRANDIFVALNADESAISEYTQTTNWYLANMRRTLEVNLEQIDSEMTRIVVTAIYNVDSDYLLDADKKIVKTVGSFVTKSPSEIADGLYVYYSPLLDSDISRDSVVVNNEDELDISIYLIADPDDSSVDFDSIKNYHPNLTLTELFADGEPCTDVYSNVPNQLWNRVMMPDMVAFDVKYVDAIGESKGFYSVEICVYQHKKSCYEANGNFTPNDAYLLAKINGSCIAGASVTSPNVAPGGNGPSPSLEPWGLYDANGVQLASWKRLVEYYGMVVEVDYDESNCENTQTSPYYVLNNYPELRSGVELILGADVTGVGDYAFYNCSGLTSVTIPDSTTRIGCGAFMNSSIASVTIGSGVEVIDSEAFWGCRNLANIIIPDSVTNIEADAFGYCMSLTTIAIPDSVIAIGDWAFYCCEALTSVIVGDGVERIGNDAFGCCSRLATITLPASLTTVGTDAFPTPSNSYIAGATGLWYDSATGDGYTPAGLATVQRTSAVTYKATKPLVKTGALAVGDSVWLNVDGVLTEFLVIQQGKPNSTLYDDSCNGTWLMMKDLYVKQVWGFSDANYSQSSVHEYLNGAFIGLLDSYVEAQIKQVKIPYIYYEEFYNDREDDYEYPEVTKYGADGLSTKVFLLSGCEIGVTLGGDNYNDRTPMPVDGACLEYFNGTSHMGSDAKRVALYGEASAEWWLRTPLFDTDAFVYYVTQYGTATDASMFSSPMYGVRPTFILDSNTQVNQLAGKNIVGIDDQSK